MKEKLTDPEANTVVSPSIVEGISSFIVIDEDDVGIIEEECSNEDWLVLELLLVEVSVNDVVVVVVDFLLDFLDVLFDLAFLVVVFVVVKAIAAVPSSLIVLVDPSRPSFSLPLSGLGT